MRSERCAAGIDARLRRSPFLVSYWRNGRLLLENYRTSVTIITSPAAILILDFFDRWRRFSGLVDALPQYEKASLLTAVRRLTALTLLERYDDRSRRSDADPWTSWHPAAGLMHFSSKDLAYEDAAVTTRALVRQAAREPRPPATKRYPGAIRLALPPPPDGGGFPDVLLQRRTWRRFSNEAVSIDSLATLLGLCCGVQFWIDAGFTRYPFKTYPSGGALHPLEVYVIARRISHLPSGIYHYAAAEHALERLPGQASAQRNAAYLPRQSWFASAAALVIITAVFPRVQWKYKFSRAYRAVLTESGHLCQSLCLTATWLGLAPFCTLALADTVIERDLRLDGINESVLYAFGFGARPAGADWAPLPGTRRRPSRHPSQWRASDD